MLGIINDILDFSKIEAGKMEMEQVDFELEDVLGNLGMVITARSEEKGIEFLLETSLGVPSHLVGDSGRLERLAGHAGRRRSAKQRRRNGVIYPAQGV